MGYGGTKTEMERLIADANEYAKANGMAADLSIDSFSDIVTAIDLVQQKQGIAGTTAKEAATTIEGSLNMTKAAWENLVTSFADPDADIGAAIDNLVVAIVGDKEGEGLLNQIIPAVQKAIEGIGKFIQSAVPLLASKLPSLIQTFVPTLIQSAISLVTSLVEALPDIVTSLANMMPEMVTLVINALIKAITKVVPILIKQGPKMVKALASGIIKSISVVASAGKRLIDSLDKAISSAISSLARKVVGFAAKIVEGIKSGLGNLYSVGSNLISGLWNGIVAKFNSVVNGVKALAAKLPAAVKKVLGITSPSKVMMEVGKWIPEGLALGIEKNIESVQDAADAMANATLFDPANNELVVDVGGVEKSGDVGLQGRFGSNGKILNITNYITVSGSADGETIADTLTRRLELNLRSI